MAYGLLNLTPDEFSKLQPHEFYSLLDGYKWRQEQQENMQAYWVSAIMSPHLKKPIAPSELLKPLRRTNTNSSKTEDKQYLKQKFSKVLK